MSESGKTQMNDGFDDAPGMVPGAVEEAQQIEPAQAKSKSQRKQLIFALLALLFAGGWSYANQDDLKMALGYSSASGNASAAGCCASKSSACCPSEASDEVMAMMDENGQCPLMAAQMAAGEESACCAEAQSAALAAALLKQPEKEIALVEAISETTEQTDVKESTLEDSTVEISEVVSSENEAESTPATQE